MKTLKTLGFSSLLAACVAVGGGATAQPYQKADDVQDMALIYQGGSHRLDWTADEFRPYVVHRFADGTKDWLFDGFLFLEFKNGSGRHYTVGYEKLNARKGEWAWLLDRIFEEGKSLSALDQCITEEIAELGKPGFKHQIVLGLPEAIRDQKDWGELNGRAMDFSKEEDQLAVTKWYIDELVKRFKAAKYRNLELSGFYWVAETNNYCGQLTVPISEYIHSLGKLFYWIPYWQSKGAEDWKALGFDVAYQQPNHFFNHSIPDSRLDDACAFARKHGMAMEFEFDEKASADRPNTSYDRMVAYIDRFEKNDVFNSSAIAYYCGNRGVLTLDESKNPKDKAVMDRLARLIRMRRYMKHGLPFKCRTQVVAHRGYWRTEGSDQNSVASLLKADELGVWGVEFDVWRAADGVLVLNHDGVHDGHNVQTTPSTTLTTLRLANGETMPTLAEYLEAAKKTRVHLVLELKPHATPEAETAAAEAAVHTLSVILITIILSFFTLVFGELVPKRVAMKKSEQVARFTCGVVAFLAAVMRPLIWLLTVSTNAVLRLVHIDPNEEDDEVSEEGIRMMVDIGEEKGAIQAGEKEMIENIFEFDNMTAGDVMIHRTDMVMLWVDDTAEEIAQTIESSGLSRFPVYEEDADDIIGILNTRDWLLNARKASPRPVRELLRPAYFVPESVRTDKLFRDMQSRKIHLSIVVDEYGGTAGLVTMEDLLEEIVGNIYDEFDPQEDQEIIALGDNRWRIAGSAELDDVAEALDMEFPEDEESETLGGLVFAQLNVIPEDGSHPEVELYGLHIRVEELTDRRVEWATVTKLAPSESEEDAE